MCHEDKTFDPNDRETTRDSAVPRPSQSEALDTPEIPSSDAVRGRAGEVVVDSVFDDDDAVDASFLTTMEDQVDLTHDDGQSAPVTPPVGPMQLPPTPRQPHSTRTHEGQGDAEHEVKKAKVGEQKKQRINQLMQQHESMIRVVKVGTDEFATMDDYSTELDINVDVPDDELWRDEDQVQFGEVPDALWSNLPLDRPPPTPEPWVDQLADDEIEIQRMWSECLESGSNDADYDVTLAPLDIKDAFLQVPQEEIVGVSLYGKELVIKRQLEQRINELNQRVEFAEGLADRNKADLRDETM
ncbi:unnamed protein product [Cladocopium goreaui]|uniref:Uncharacterized protein n=1 Tax=Cladocopium goreaui TaxID=2562237 RepID=A0A9P1FMP0_9DINO|nr:unnamed protein product [Cladocopium goreaui]